MNHQGQNNHHDESKTKAHRFNNLKLSGDGKCMQTTTVDGRVMKVRTFTADRTDHTDHA